MLVSALAVRGEQGRTEGKAEGRIEGKAEGRIEGKAEGRIEGKAEGRIEGKPAELLAILAGRGLNVRAAYLRRVRSTRDEAKLDRWLAEAASCASTSELFARRARAPRIAASAAEATRIAHLPGGITRASAGATRTLGPAGRLGAAGPVGRRACPPVRTARR